VVRVSSPDGGKLAGYIEGLDWAIDVASRRSLSANPYPTPYPSPATGISSIGICSAGIGTLLELNPVLPGKEIVEGPEGFSSRW